ncbi:uncharacterized protein SEPMUDRAFT_132664 [Sphaerulina musiva SO2202]|uniref:Uncharacterized protein n=1 Tax=Sphaerulina musiva (strain SO2202) TaxID=692275 RepID=M3CHT2_SPHMS|nr:uncharacterized protein SEPMUDRAFT_132664 [Sphaerulina musiva SO2202]EMF13343.1 hypothetical protein SEPMUDRAFT_132664 [Sphaerulina musiva SO2202]
MKDIWCCYDSTPSCNYQGLDVFSPKDVGNCRDGRAPRSMRIACDSTSKSMSSSLSLIPPLPSTPPPHTDSPTDA